MAVAKHRFTASYIIQMLMYSNQSWQWRWSGSEVCKPGNPLQGLRLSEVCMLLVRWIRYKWSVLCVLISPVSLAGVRINRALSCGSPLHLTNPVSFPTGNVTLGYLSKFQYIRAKHVVLNSDSEQRSLNKKKNYS